MHEEKKMEIKIPKRLNLCVQESLDQIRVEQKQKKRRRWVKRSVFATAACIAITTLVIKQPTWAENFPLLGNIFSYLKETGSIQENYTQHATQIGASKVAGTDKEKYKDNTLSQKKNGIIVTLSEMMCTENTLYMAVELEKEGGFQQTEEAVRVSGIFTCSIGEKDTGMANVIEGKIVDGKMVGMLAFDLSKVWNNGGEIPMNFETKLCMQILHLPDEKSSDRYPDTWNFSVTVPRDSSMERLIEVNEQNQDGYGIAWVKKNPYELSVKVIQPAKGGATVILCDANGERLQNTQYATDTVVQTWDRDLSKVYVFVCDLDEYLKEKEAYQEQSKTETYAEFMSSHCMYKKIIEF